MPVVDPSGGDIRRRVDLAEAVGLTTQMRSSAMRLWRQVRERIEAEGRRPLDAAVGSLMPDDVDQREGLILLRSGEAFLFETELEPGADGAATWNQRESLTLWNRLTPEGEKRYARWLKAAAWVLDSGLD